MEWINSVDGFLVTPLGIAIIALGSMADAVIGIGFIVYGEIFFIAAGYLMATERMYYLLPLVYCAAWLGDLISFSIGYHGGHRVLIKIIGKKQRRRRAYRKVKLTIDRYGYPGITLSRLLGPISWVAPFAAGTMRLSPYRFGLYSSVGVILGVSQFILIGYLLGGGIELSRHTLAFEYMPLLISIATAFVGSLLVFRIMKRFRIRPAVQVMAHGVVWGTAFVVMNCWLFFFSVPPYKDASTSVSADQLIQQSFKVYPGFSGGYNAQPVNLILVTDLPLHVIHDRVGWVENKTFSGDQISIGDYLKLVRENTPPVTDLFLGQKPQSAAFQDPGGNLIYRHHVRWWKIDGWSDSPSIYAGTVSTDDEIQLKLYRGILALIHDIHPDVDSARDLFIKGIGNAYPHAAVEYMLPPGRLTAPETSGDYSTDGKVVVIKITSTPDAVVSNNTGFDPDSLITLLRLNS